MNFKKSLLVLTASAVLIFSGCSKDDDNSSSTPTQTNLQLLTAHGWRMTNFYVNGIDVTSTYYTACELDNILTFNTDYTYVEDEGATKCNASDPQIVDSGTWGFGNNQTILIYAPGTPSEADFNITQLNANNLKYQETYFDSTSMTNIVYQVSLIKN